MNTVLISPYSKTLRNGKVNPKNYPFWNEVINELSGGDVRVIQLGVSGEDKFNNVNGYAFDKTLEELEVMVKECTTWCSVDNFFQHFCYSLGKPGVVIFGQSDPLIFGHDLNDNLLKSRSYLREPQFNFWESVEYSKECFVEPQVVVEAILRRVFNGN